MLSAKKREILPAKQILDAYKEGRRDFSGVLCQNDSFDNYKLPGIIFRNADLSYCSFYGTNFEGADFSGANLEWTGFIRTNLKRAVFEKARCVWSRFNESVFEKTNMRKADLSWSLFFNTNLYGGADLTGAITATIATDPSQITEEGLKKLAGKLGNAKLEPELLTRLQLIASSTKEKKEKDQSGKTEDRSVYGGAKDTSYSRNAGGNYNSQGGQQGEYNTGGAKGVEYGGQKKKKRSYEQ